MTLFIGIDPGRSRAIAILNGSGELLVVDDLPVIRDKSLAWINGGELQGFICILRSTTGAPRRC